MTGIAYGWTGIYFKICNQDIYSGNMTQFVDMQAGQRQNAYLEQAVLTKSVMNCTLSFNQKAFSTNNTLYKLEIYWNYMLIATQVANTTEITFQNFAVKTIKGFNILAFREMGVWTDNHGMFIDDVSLICYPDNITISPIIPQIAIRPVSLNDSTFSLNVLISSLPLNSKPSFQVLYTFVEDLWLYNYDKPSHSRVLGDVFQTIAYVQLMKFRFLDNLLGFAKYSNSLPLSNYTEYTQDKFAKIEGSESVLVTSNFAFFLYSIPQNIVVCFLLYALFVMLSRYKISTELRCFYFFKTVLMQKLVL